ncbi:MAG: hypothetical protein ACRD2L_05620, partial [Terriglobia bacterium]
KLPTEYLKLDNKLGLFSLRHSASLAALKLYLLLVTFRSKETNYAAISYEKIAEYTGLNRTAIKKGISILINSELVTVYSSRNPADGEPSLHGHNRYLIRGL